MCVFLISPVPITEPLTSELINTPVFYNLAPRPIKYRVSVPSLTLWCVFFYICNTFHCNHWLNALLFSTLWCFCTYIFVLLTGLRYAHFWSAVIQYFSHPAVMFFHLIFCPHHFSTQTDAPAYTEPTNKKIGLSWINITPTGGFIPFLQLF